MENKQSITKQMAGYRVLTRKEEALYRGALAVPVLMTGVLLILYGFYYRHILELSGMVTYALCTIGMFVSVFVCYGCFTSRNIFESCSKYMMQLMVPTDLMLLFNAVLCILRNQAVYKVQIELLNVPLIMVLTYLLWCYVHAVMPLRRRKNRWMSSGIKAFVQCGILVWAIFFVYSLSHLDRTDTWIKNLIRYERVVLVVFVIIILLAVNVRVIVSGGARLQKIIMFLVSQFMIGVLIYGAVRDWKQWQTGSSMAYGLVVLMISTTLFPARIRIQEIISRVLAIVLLCTALIYGQIVLWNIEDVFYEDSMEEANELLEAGADILNGISPYQLKYRDDGAFAADTLEHVISIAHDKLLFAESIDASSQARADVIVLNRSQESLKEGRYYPDVDIRKLLPDRLLPEERAVLTGKLPGSKVVLTGKERVVLCFHQWIGPNDKVEGLIGVCFFPRRWMVGVLSDLYVEVVPILFLIMAGVLLLVVIINRTLIRGMNETIENIRRFFAGEGWMAQTKRVSDSYEGSYFSMFFKLLTDELKDREESLVREVKERERINADLDLAAAVQKNILPNQFPPYPARNEFSIFASMHPARAVGGDFYDFFFLDPDHLVLLIADVSGKGIPAALFMMTARSILRSAMEKCQDPAAALEMANRQLSDHNEEKMFVTVWLGILEMSTGRLTDANAGHEKLLVTRDGAWEYSEGENGIALGLFEPVDGEKEQEPAYFNHEIYLKAGDVLFQYTDGVPETVNGEKKFFGMESLKETLESLACTDPKELVDAVNHVLEQYRGTEKQFDDITILSLLYKGVDAERTGANEVG